MPQHLPQPAASGTLTVSDQEAGMKLLRFLERALPDTPRSALHKWIRTGQVRVNGGRAKPFQILAAGDAVRLPPFAVHRSVEGPPDPADSLQLSGRSDRPSPQRALGDDIRIISLDQALLVLAKPAGLACQGGSGTEDSLAARLRAAFAARPFIPAPAHRLDKHTSGLVLAGMTHNAQRRLHELFKSGGVRKEYLAWAAGVWPGHDVLLLTDMLTQQKNPLTGRETVAALPGGLTEPLVAAPPDSGQQEDAAALSSGHTQANGLLARCAVTRVQTIPWPDAAVPDARASLLLVRLLTGRKHQIRVQLASRGSPIIGDRRYHGPVFPRMLLHAFTLSLPFPPAAGSPPLAEYSCPPDWPAAWLPDPEELAEARDAMAVALRHETGKTPESNPGEP